MTKAEWTKSRIRRCSRCQAIKGKLERFRLCNRCMLAICPVCEECGEPLDRCERRTGICFRCEPGSDYWIELHLEETHEN